MKDQTCKNRWANEKNSTLATVRKLWTPYLAGNEDGDPDLGSFPEYGLGFDYVAPGTFPSQRVGYWRWQISWGGPSEEFRFYARPSGRGYALEAVKFAFLDWYDGYSRALRGRDLELLREVWLEYFLELGAVEDAYRKAVED